MQTKNTIMVLMCTGLCNGIEEGLLNVSLFGNKSMRCSGKLNVTNLCVFQTNLASISQSVVSSDIQGLEGSGVDRKGS